MHAGVFSFPEVIFGMFNPLRCVHGRRVRIAIPWVILLSILAVALPGWLGMKNADFLTPPDEATLDTIRVHTESALPRLATQADAISPQGSGSRIIAAAPPIQLGNLSAPPQLNEYADRAPRGAAHIIEIANRLEDEGHPHRALLAWERVIDSANPSPAELDAAIEATARLRPALTPWNRSPDDALPIIIHAGTGEKSAETFAPALKQAAADLERATSGMLKVTTTINASADAEQPDAPVPVAIWISGPDGVKQSTEVMSFTVTTPDSLEYDVQRTLYQLIRNQLRQSTAVNAPPALPDDGDPRQATTTRLTRLHWHALGTFLNSTVENPQTDE